MALTFNYPAIPGGPPKHLCRVSSSTVYQMPASWIDTDNKVWEEPFHLYTDLCRDQPEPIKS